MQLFSIPPLNNSHVPNSPQKSLSKILFCPGALVKMLNCCVTRIKAALPFGSTQFNMLEACSLPLQPAHTAPVPSMQPVYIIPLSSLLQVVQKPNLNAWSPERARVWASSIAQEAAISKPWFFFYH